MAAVAGRVASISGGIAAAAVFANSAASAAAAAATAVAAGADCDVASLGSPSLAQLTARFQSHQPSAVHSNNIQRSLELIRAHVDAELANPDTPPDKLSRLRRRFRKVGSQAAVLVGMYSAPLTREMWESSETARLLWPEFRADAEHPQDEWWVLLTTRSSKLKSHPGDTALPGGSIDAADGANGDPAGRAALREAEEEVNLPPSRSQLLGRLPSIISRDYSEVLAIPAIVPRPWLPHDPQYWSMPGAGADKKGPASQSDGFQVIPNADEVEHVFSAPLRLFLTENPQCYTSFESQWLAGLYRVHNFRWMCPPALYAHNSAWAADQHARGQPAPAAAHEFRIWGLTAWALIQTAQVAYSRPAPFPDALVLSIGDPRLQPKAEEDDPRPLMAKLWSRL